MNNYTKQFRPVFTCFLVGVFAELIISMDFKYFHSSGGGLKEALIYAGGLKRL